MLRGILTFVFVAICVFLTVVVLLERKMLVFLEKV